MNIDWDDIRFDGKRTFKAKGSSTKIARLYKDKKD